MATNVLLLGGFGVPTALLRPLARDLTRAGHDVRIAPLGMNVDCGERTAQRVLDLLADEPIALVGHSRGGQIARVVAVRAPDTVHTLVTAGTPWTIGPPPFPGVAAVTPIVRALRVMPSIDCATADCCTTYRADLACTPAAHWVALHSSRDRIAGADSAPPPEADEARDTRTTHTGFVSSKEGRAAIAAALTRR